MGSGIGVGKFNIRLESRGDRVVFAMDGAEGTYYRTPGSTEETFWGEIANLRAELARLRQERDAMKGVVDPALAYYRAYMAGHGHDGCTDPFSSGPHDDHECVISLRARMHRALAVLDGAEGGSKVEGGNS